MKSKPSHLRVSSLTKKPKCFAPWINLYAQKREDWWRFKVCCLSEEVVEVDSIDEYFDSDHIKQVTKSLLENKFPSACVRCEFNAEVDEYPDIAIYQYQILRIRHKKNLYKNNEDRLAWTNSVHHDPDDRHDKFVLREFEKLSLDDIKEILSSDDDKFIQLDLRPGNLCNLKCKMCNTASSTEIAKEYVDFHQDKEFIDKLKKTDHDKSSQILAKDDIDYFKKLSKNYTNTKEHKEEIYELFDYANLRRLKLLGGEPSIDPTIISILKTLKEKNLHKDDSFRLQITSNLTNVNKIWLDYFKLFNIKLTVSMDGAGRTYEYIRAPFKWKAIEQNLYKLPANLYKDLSVNVVGSNIMFLDLKEWIPQFTDLQKMIPFHINYIECKYPNHMTLQAIPLEYKFKIKDDLNSLKKYYKSNTRINELLSHMERDLDNHLKMKDTFKRHYLDQFFLINRKQDELRRQNLFDINYTKEIYNNLTYRR